MALDPPAAVLPALQLLHAASFGATHLGTLGFLAAKAPARQFATAQGIVAVTNGITMAGATALSGVLFAAFGGIAYAAICVVDNLANGVGGAPLAVEDFEAGKAPRLRRGRCR